MAHPKTFQIFFLLAILSRPFFLINSAVFEFVYFPLDIYRCGNDCFFSAVRYMYHVGGHRTGWGDLLFFRSMPAGKFWSPRFAVYGDLGKPRFYIFSTRHQRSLPFLKVLHHTSLFPSGIELGHSIPPLQTEAALGHFDAVLHIGDMAYDMFLDNAR